MTCMNYLEAFLQCFFVALPAKLQDTSTQGLVNIDWCIVDYNCLTICWVVWVIPVNTYRIDLHLWNNSNSHHVDVRLETQISRSPK